MMNIRETAEYLRISVSTLHRLIKGKKLRAYKVGGQWRLRRAEIDKCLIGGKK